jgi:hypothetical protein
MKFYHKVIFIGLMGLLLFNQPQISVIKAQEPAATGTASRGPEVSKPVTPAISRPVRLLPRLAEATAAQGGEVNPRQLRPQPQGLTLAEPAPPDPLIQQTPLNSQASPSLSLSFDGITAAQGGGAVPPDTVGDVGPNHYVQMVNIALAIYDKSGALLSGPTDIGALWNGAGGNCEFNGRGDPIVLYDPLANRWLISQFADPNHMCIAISQTADPTGAFYLYEFNVTNFPDYFKFGVWPDGYYMSANESSYTAYAFDRPKMLAGQAATFQKFSGQTNLLLPSDLDGAAAPPTGAPNYFYTFKDNPLPEPDGESDRLEIFAFHVDFTTPANSTFTQVATIPIASFTYTVCNFFVLACIPQPAPGQKVDAVSEWPMFRLAYRNFGSYETLVGNFTVDVGSDRAGIRWFELRKSGSGLWALYQEGTHAPDSHHRWMGSMAMDQDGNIALGYSVSSTTLTPTLRYATRLNSDTLGTLQSEATLIAGSGVQTNGANRWGDYSAMSVDPSDDCTFWYTNEYYATTSARSWRTRIGAFVLPECLAATSFEYYLPLIFKSN